MVIPYECNGDKLCLTASGRIVRGGKVKVYG